MVKRGKKAAKPVKAKKEPAKAKKAKQPTPKAIGKSKEKKPVHLVTTIGRGGNPSSAMAVAPEPEPLDLGPLDIPVNGDAERVLRELAILNDRVLGAHKAMKDAQATAKSRKDKWDELSEELQTKLRRWTHKSDLPLFDAEEREQDQARMEAGPTSEGLPLADPLDENRPGEGPESTEDDDQALELTPPPPDRPDDPSGAPIDVDTVF